MGCGCNPCNCTDLSQNNCVEICTAVYTQNSFNIPACGQTALVDVPKLKTIIVGAYLWNPTYGFFLIQSFNSITGQVLILNECISGNATPGTIVPANTQFAVTPPPESSLDNGGWITPLGTWTYLNATNITVPSDATVVYQKGDRVRLIQSAVTKYFYVVDVPNSTTITITGGSDYTLVNAAITEQVFSREPRPFGFPGFFNWSPTLVGFSANPTTVLYRFNLTGTKCSMTFRQGVTGTSNATSFTVSLPITAAAITNDYWGAFAWAAVDNGSTVTAVGYIVGSGTVVNMGIGSTGGTPWTNSGGKRADLEMWYEI